MYFNENRWRDKEGKVVSRSERTDSRKEKRNYLTIKSKERRSERLSVWDKNGERETYRRKERKKCPQRKRGEDIRGGENAGGEKVKGNDSTHRAKIKIEDEKW